MKGNTGVNITPRNRFPIPNTSPQQYYPSPYPIFDRPVYLNPPQTPPMKTVTRFVVPADKLLKFDGIPTQDALNTGAQAWTLFQ